MEQMNLNVSILSSPLSSSDHPETLRVDLCPQMRYKPRIAVQSNPCILESHMAFCGPARAQKETPFPVVQTDTDRGSKHLYARTGRKVRELKKGVARIKSKLQSKWGSRDYENMTQIMKKLETNVSV